MDDNLKILYSNMGGVALYSCDKTAGRILGWVDKGNGVFLLAPKLIEETAQKRNLRYQQRSGKNKNHNLPAHYLAHKLKFGYYLLLFSAHFAVSSDSFQKNSQIRHRIFKFSGTD